MPGASESVHAGDADTRAGREASIGAATALASSISMAEAAITDANLAAGNPMYNDATKISSVHFVNASQPSLREAYLPGSFRRCLTRPT